MIVLPAFMIAAVLFHALIRQTRRADRNEAMLIEMIDASRKLIGDVEAMGVNS